jgi:flagellar biosynthesis anti-sigma factor FlgM
MTVNGLESVQSSFPIKPAQSTSTPPVQKNAETKPIATKDELEISSTGKMLEHLNQSPEIRAERLAQIKAAIDAGQYETPEKFEIALKKMIAEIELEGETQS